MSPERDWKTEPPTTLEEAFQLVEQWAERACDEAERAFGERPRYERRERSVVIVWPDGEETNKFEVSYVQ